MIGRLDTEKGIEELIQAVKRLPSDVTFRFVGDGAYREVVEQQLAAEIEAGQVELTGWVDHDEVPAHLNGIKLLVLASEPTEGLPTAIQEAFACGTPIYATPVSGIPSVVAEGETGFLMQDRSPGRIAEKVESILSREDLPEISETCRAFAVKNYSFEASVDNFECLLVGLQRE
jgi:glycosyltransferase involved in cell wall biosynthesis